VQRALHRAVADQHTGTLRAKKAVACLLWMTDYSLEQIEGILTQFGGAFGGAAGPVRAVASRTSDLLPTVTRVAELLHPGLDLSERQARLLVRLELGVPEGVVELALRAGSTLTRGDYLRLLRAGLTTVEAVERSEDDAVLDYLGGSEPKLRALREALRARPAQVPPVVAGPILPPPDEAA
jgi:helicase